MKKILTVLLALSVVFTYTVGTAFALPSDGTSQAGLTAAKEEAIAELDSYLDNINDYTEVGQKLLEAEVLKGQTEIDAAKTIAAVKTALNKAEKSITNLKMEGYLISEVKDAINAAKTQIKDYLSILGYVETSGNSDAKIDTLLSDGNIALDSLKLSADDAKAFSEDWKNAYNTLKSSSSLSDVEKNLNKVLIVIDKYLNKFSSVEVTDTQIKALVNAITDFASTKNVSTATHSASIVNQYDDMVEEAIAAAKAVKTMKDYYNVIEEYLGSKYNGATVKALAKDYDSINKGAQYGYVVVKDGVVYIYEISTGKLNRLVNMTKDVEKQINAAERIQTALGDYNYKDIAKDKWKDAETYRLGLADFIESGDENDLPTSLKSVITSIKATDKASVITQKVNQAVAIYDEYTKLAEYKENALNEIGSYYGTEFDGSDATAASYSADIQAQIANLQQLYTNYINIASTFDSVDSYVEAYKDRVNTYKTAKEAEIDENYDDVAATIDRVVEETIGNVSLNADQQTLLDRIISDVKASVKSGESFPFGWGADQTDEFKDNWMKNNTIITAFGSNVGDKYTVDVIAADIRDKIKAFDSTKLYGYDIAITNSDSSYPRANYNQNDYGLEIKDIEKAKGYLDVEKQSVTSWVEYLAQYDKYVAQCNAVKTQAQIEYEEAVADAESAITALGTVENTKAFETKLATATKAIEAIENHVYANKDRDDISNIDAYDNAVYELAYLKYLDSKNKVASTIPAVNAFNEIALGITDAKVIGLYAKAEQNQILEIVTTARDAIDAAETDSAKADLAEKAIADLQSITQMVDSTDYNEALAENKAEATKYFDKYYNANFSSDAVTATELIADILEFNADKVIDYDKIVAVESLKVVKNHSTAGRTNGKSWIRIEWSTIGDDSAVDGYEIYKSTKKNSGYKYAFTTKNPKNKWYKNTAGLKKGTMYYYKVRAFVEVDGQKYYSDWSNKAYRKAK